MKKITEYTREMLAISMLKGVGPATLRQISMHSGAQGVSLNKAANTFPKVMKALDDPRAWDRATELAEEQVYFSEESDARILSVLDDEYPTLLARSSDAPYFLFVKGQLHSSPSSSVGVVGTRHPTEHGRIIAERVTKFFVEQGWSIVSGLALGCDAIAHQAALDGQGHTVAVLAHGLHTIAPARHRKLANQILEQGGGLISEYGFGVEPMPANFVKRDKTQAGMSQGVVMIQSDHKGGSLHASRAAIKYGRWLAVPFPTKKDRDNNELKIQANMTLAEGTDNEKIELLKGSKEDVSKIKVLYSKEDYTMLVNFSAFENGDDSSEGRQGQRDLF